MKNSRMVGRPEARLKWQVWVYHDVDWSPAMERATRGGSCDGSGCCTEGFTDSSFTFPRESSARRAAKSLSKIAGVGWVKIYPEDEIERTETFFGPASSAKLRAKLRSRISGGFSVKKSRPKKTAKKSRSKKPAKQYPRGWLHRKLRIPLGKKISVAALKRAARGRGEVARRAQRVLNYRGYRTGKRR